MPFSSLRQERFIHAEAGDGVPWAKSFVSHSGRKSMNRKQRIRAALERNTSAQRTVGKGKRVPIGFGKPRNRGRKYL